VKKKEHKVYFSFPTFFFGDAKDNTDDYVSLVSINYDYIPFYKNTITPYVGMGLSYFEKNYYDANSSMYLTYYGTGMNAQTGLLLNFNKNFALNLE